ncbi:MBL fold metallo-hydrolase [Paenibacillus antibioticophila]|uniref:MBL fold metallo-hydrolase n=1 Tax=Paenibacillus antibioticophila TaxID=1274374 RepID=UPI0005CAA477|nr:MBL fold metallo-hydrolase [Paenibacillus antibioticophila]
MQCRVIGMWGGFPKQNGPTSGYLIEHQGFTVMLDCGSGVLVKAQDYIDLNKIDHVVLSHYHYDHNADIGAYLYSRLVNTQIGRADTVLNIYGPESESFRKEVEGMLGSRFKSFDETTSLTLGPFLFEFKKNAHTVEAYAMKITCEDKVMVYTSDTLFTDDLISFAQGADLLITECSLYHGTDGSRMGHMTSREAGILAHHSQAKKVLLTHLPHYGNLQDLLEDAKQQGNRNVHLAEPGMLIEL